MRPFEKQVGAWRRLRFSGQNYVDDRHRQRGLQGRLLPSQRCSAEDSGTWIMLRSSMLALGP